jgi:hypothetical protein
MSPSAGMALRRGKSRLNFGFLTSGARRDQREKYLIWWRRAGDSNSHGPCGPVDFKSTALPVEASPP